MNTPATTGGPSFRGRLLFILGLTAFAAFISVPKDASWKESGNKFVSAIGNLGMQLGIDLQGGTRIEYEIPDQFKHVFTSPDVMQQMLQRIHRRIDNLGVLEVTIEQLGTHRFVIELPGVEPALVDRVKTLMAKQGKLELRLTANLSRNQTLQEADTRLREQIKDLEQNINTEDPRQRGEGVARLLTGQLPKSMGDQYMYFFHYETRAGQTPIQDYVLVEKQVQVRGEDIDTATVQPEAFGWVPGFSLKPSATQHFCSITRAHKEGSSDPRQLAIILDDHLVSAPSIAQEICGGTAIIRGDFTYEECEDMVNVFSSGQLPAVPVPLREETTGPSIGLQAQKSGLIAGVLSIIVVLAFMFLYYLGAGAVANIALLVNAVLLIGVLSFFNATMTLPGIAGLILTLGMAVDANILIYERIREESAKGKTLAQAIANGYSRAFVTILDSNLTTLLTGAILFWVGSGAVRGFAVALCAGIAISMFTAIYITRLIFEIFLARGALTELKMLNLIGVPKFDYMRIAPGLITTSAVFIAIGMGLFVVLFDEVQGIDLKGGTYFRVESSQPIEPGALNARLESVNAKVNEWLATDEWQSVVELEVEPGAPAPTKPALSPLASIVPQPLYVNVTADRAAAPDGSFYEYGLKSRTLDSQSYSLIQKALAITPEGQPTLTVKEKTEISSKIARETAISALIAVIVASLGILIYITMRFEFHFGLGAIVAMIHDVAVTLGVIAICHHFNLVDVEISLTVIAAILTLIGYSLNDTIVVFDRIRENLRGAHKLSAELINTSVNETMSRTVLTGGTTILVLLILMFLNWGQGSVLEGFAFTILVGVVVGTYSSIFIASPFVLMWQTWLTNRAKAGETSKSK